MQLIKTTFCGRLLFCAKRTIEYFLPFIPTNAIWTHVTRPASSVLSQLHIRSGLTTPTIDSSSIARSGLKQKHKNDYTSIMGIHPSNNQYYYPVFRIHLPVGTSQRAKKSTVNVCPIISLLHRSHCMRAYMPTICYRYLAVIALAINQRRRTVYSYEYDLYCTACTTWPRRDYCFMHAFKIIMLLVYIQHWRPLASQTNMIIAHLREAPDNFGHTIVKADGSLKIRKEYKS